MALSSLRDVLDAYAAGATAYCGWRRTPSANDGSVTTSWYDLGTSAGSGLPNDFAGAPATATVPDPARGAMLWPNGGAVSPSIKYLGAFSAAAPTPAAAIAPFPAVLVDYLLWYPFLASGISKTLSNPVSLTRYTDGADVQILPVAQPGQLLTNANAGGTFSVTYTNSSGVAGRVTPTHTFSSNVNTWGTRGGIPLVTASTAATVGAPFLTLQAGDTGVRSIQAFTSDGASSEQVLALALVKPLLTVGVRNIDAVAEIDLLLNHDRMPRVYDDAFLSLLMLSIGNSFATISFLGHATFVWG